MEGVDEDVDEDVDVDEDEDAEDEGTARNPERSITLFLKCGNRLEVQVTVWQTALSLERNSWAMIY